MIKLQIININDYTYSLKDMNENEYKLNLEFLDVEERPKIRDYIYISAELLNPIYEGYSTSYTFGDLNNKYGKNNLQQGDIDIVRIETENKMILLKRLYG